jgi:hypothetical protein
LKAYHRERNRRQNFLRWTVDRTSITSTWNPTQWHDVRFDTDTYPDASVKGRKVHSVPTISWRWTCQEPGIYNFKGQLTVLISLPAVPATRITRVFLRLKHSHPVTNPFGTGHVQSEEIAPAGVIAGAPEVGEQLYLRGFSLPIKDKLVMEAGDRITVEWMFNGLGAIGFIEEYKGYIAIQKTGEKYIDGSCDCD